MVLEVLGFDGVAETSLVFLPGYREGQTWEEVVNDYRVLEVAFQTWKAPGTYLWG